MCARHFLLTTKTLLKTWNSACHIVEVVNEILEYIYALCRVQLITHKLFVNTFNMFGIALLQASLIDKTCTYKRVFIFDCDANKCKRRL